MVVVGVRVAHRSLTTDYALLARPCFGAHRWKMVPGGTRTPRGPEQQRMHMKDVLETRRSAPIHDMPRSASAVFPDGTLYAKGRFNSTDMWFVVKELARRTTKEPSIKVRFLSRLDGSTMTTLLPSPSIDWVYEVTTTKPRSCPSFQEPSWVRPDATM